MATVTDRHGNVLSVEPDTLEDWRQAAQVEAGIRREFQGEVVELRSALRDCMAHVPAHIEERYRHLIK